jgi:hypothetical protein
MRAAMGAYQNSFKQYGQGFLTPDQAVAWQKMMDEQRARMQGGVGN